MRPRDSDSAHFHLPSLEACYRGKQRERVRRSESATPRRLYWPASRQEMLESFVGLRHEPKADTGPRVTAQRFHKGLQTNPFYARFARTTFAYK